MNTFVTIPHIQTITIMQLHITPESTIAEIQKEFHRFYTFLKIEFYSEPHKAGELSREKYRIAHDKKMFEVGKKNVNAIFEWSENTTVSAFEKELFGVCGLSIQVFRKSGNIWIETSITDKWTLEKQNQEARLMVLAIEETQHPVIEEADFER